MRHLANWLCLFGFAAGCTVATVQPLPVEGELAARIAVAVAKARRSPEPAPKPTPGECCKQCENGWITHGDGHRTPCPCPATCKCKSTGEKR